jgi:superfamily I DNA/RNA helicase
MLARRVGRGGQLGRARRRAIWPVFAEYRAQLVEANLREPEEAFREARQLLQNEKPPLGIRAMVVDEAQDISAAAFELIRAAVPSAENDLFIVGDAHQRIYRHKVALSKTGIEVRGRSRSLKVNYRTTDEIRRWACAQIEGCEIDDLDGEKDSLRGYLSLTHGDPPELVASASLQEDVKHILGLIRQLESDGREARGICITARTNDELDTLAKDLRQAGVECLKLEPSTPDDSSTPGIRLATMHRIKGLEFDVVIIAGYRGASRYAEPFGREADVGVAAEKETEERCLLHVAATRAKRNLFLLQRPSAQ